MDYYADYYELPTDDISEYYLNENKWKRLPWEDTMGMMVTSGSVTINKDSQNLVGVSIGGGAPHCPCLYIVQIFDNAPAAKDGTLASGDEIVGVNGTTVKGRTKGEVARMIQTVQGEVTINYNKLHADPKQGKTLDLVLKKVKHRVVENMNSGTADALGLSRAILCNDALVKKLEELEKTADAYRNMVNQTKSLLRAFYNLSQSHLAFGNVFSSIGVKEPLREASLVFSKFGDAHREIEKNGIKMLKTVKPMISDLNTFLNKAVPDTRLTVKKYLDAKFEYLSYCLKVKEMDDEEYSCNALNEALYRVETGNYEYRLLLRCRQLARLRFAKLRNDVLVKIELLDNKHVQDVVFQLQRLVTAWARYNTECHAVMKDHELFPIEVDLSRSTFNYNTTGRMDCNDEDEDGDTQLVGGCCSNTGQQSTTDESGDNTGQQQRSATSDIVGRHQQQLLQQQQLQQQQLLQQQQHPVVDIFASFVEDNKPSATNESSAGGVDSTLVDLTSAD